MRMSTKGRYGLRAMLDLAVNSKGGPVAIKDVAERQDLSSNYMEQIFSTLRKSGLVKSIKGAQGGYILAHDPSKLIVGDILRALEGDMNILDEDTQQTEIPDNMETFLKISVWSKINECINSVIDSITLEDLIVQFKKICSQEEFMYYI